MTWQSINRTIITTAMLCLSAMAAGGCSSSVGPVPPGQRDSNSTVGMPEPVPIDILNEMIDETAQYLARELPPATAAQAGAAGTKLVFATPVTLETRLRVDDGRLRLSLDSLQTKLKQSDQFRGQFVVIAATELQAQGQLNRVAGADTSTFRDPLQRTADNTQAASYNPVIVYTMSGRFFQATDSAEGKRSYRLFVRIEHPQSRTMILSHEFHRELVWDSSRGQWRLAV